MVRRLIAMRGSIIEWFHAIPVPPSDINVLTGEPNVTLGVQLPDTGAFGEGYPKKPVNIRAFLSSKVSRAPLTGFGVVEAGDLQLDIATPFVAEPPDLVIPTEAMRADFDAGQFFVIPKGGVPRADRFIIQGRRYTAKALPVPIIDKNVTVCWRLLIAKAEF